MKNKRFILDTSFISSIIFYDKNTLEAEALAKTFTKEDSIFIPAMVILELSSIAPTKDSSLVYDSIKRLDKQFRAEIIYYDKKFINSFIKFRKDNSFRAKAPDASILYTSIYTNSELITFDKKLMRLYKKLTK